MCLGVPAQIVSLGEDEGVLSQGVVRIGQVTKAVALGFVPEAQVGEYVLVHAGVALNRLEAEQAQRIINDLESLEEPVP